MSQSGILSDSTTASADIETLTGDTGGAVSPDAANNVDVQGGTNITVTGTPASNLLTISQNNVALGTGQTVGAVTADIITVDCDATPGTYQIEAHVAAFEAGTPAGAGYELINAVRTTGAAATLCGTTDNPGLNREAALLAANCDIIVSGNTFVVRATGSAGLTIEWSAKLEYVFAS
jgi:hypothetical protein